MKNFIEHGDTILYTNEDITDALAISCGDFVLIGSGGGVAVVDIPVGESGAVKLTGVYDLPKVSAQAWTQGQKLYWAAATGEVTSTASSNKLIGFAWAAAANPSATGRVKLTGAFTI